MIPEQIQVIINKLNTLYPDTCVNSCLLTRYKSGQNICPPHSDNEPYIAPQSNIFILSFGSERVMKFSAINNTSNSVEVSLSDNSLISFSRSSQESWKHEIISSDGNLCRYSFTFRQVAPHFANSTIIIGDSNTENLKFGCGRETFGIWLPGQRMKAGRVDDIPTPNTMKTPYRHMVIHCGINDIRAYNPLPIHVIVDKLEAKCRAFVNAFPHMRIHVSLLLPSKDLKLNGAINEMNRLITLFTKKYYRMSVITHNNISDASGYMKIEYGRHHVDGSPKMNDLVHLGRKGIAIFCLNIKRCIVKMKNDYSVKVDSNVVEIPPESSYPYFNPNPNYSEPPINESVSPSQARFEVHNGDYSQAFHLGKPQTFDLNCMYNGYQY